MVSDLESEIEAARHNLAELDRQRELAAARLTELERLRGSGTPTGTRSTEWPAASKLRLFRDLFRGRDDVFAVRWENQRRGRSGYSPRCANEWQPGVCGKPKVRCGECANQAFVALDDRQLLAHLQGRQVIGIYPLLPDDRCRLLAIDLDRGSWRADARALAQTCRSLGLHPAIERSRSGNGAHLWFFFTDPVQAANARRLGFTILTATMAQGATLGVDSYDRLFPSQDVLPSGGFGNLIALPLQRAARNAGNSEFVDDRLEPHRDQWSYLASIPRITPQRLAELVVDGDEDTALAVRPETDQSDPPWRPPRTLRERLSATRLPESIEATLADRVYIGRSNLPPTLAHAIRRLATFANPMFNELQRMRLSVARTPRVIGCFDDLDRHLALPRGCLSDVASLVAELGVKLDLRDERVDGETLGVEFCGELNNSQHSAARAILQHDVGVLCAPPSWGKTVVATNLIASRGCSTLVLVHRKPLVEQWTERLCEFLDITPKSIGRFGAGRRRLTRRIDIAMVQTLARSDDLHDLVRAYGHVVIDECHHVPAVQVERVLSGIPARYVTGLTSSYFRRSCRARLTPPQTVPRTAEFFFVGALLAAPAVDVDLTNGAAAGPPRSRTTAIRHKTSASGATEVSPACKRWEKPKNNPKRRRCDTIPRHHSGCTKSVLVSIRTADLRDFVGFFVISNICDSRLETMCDVTGQLKPSKEIMTWAKKVARFLSQLPLPIELQPLGNHAKSVKPFSVSSRRRSESHGKKPLRHPRSKSHDL